MHLYNCFLGTHITYFTYFFYLNLVKLRFCIRTSELGQTFHQASFLHILPFKSIPFTSAFSVHQILSYVLLTSTSPLPALLIIITPRYLSSLTTSFFFLLKQYNTVTTVTLISKNLVLTRIHFQHRLPFHASLPVIHITARHHLPTTTMATSIVFHRTSAVHRCHYHCHVALHPRDASPVRTLNNHVHITQH